MKNLEPTRVYHKNHIYIGSALNLKRDILRKEFTLGRKTI